MKFIDPCALSSASSLVPKVTEFCNESVLISLFHGSLYKRCLPGSSCNKWMSSMHRSALAPPNKTVISLFTFHIIDCGPKYPGHLA